MFCILYLIHKISNLIRAFSSLPHFGYERLVAQKLLVSSLTKIVVTLICEAFSQGVQFHTQNWLAQLKLCHVYHQECPLSFLNEYTH